MKTITISNAFYRNHEVYTSEATAWNSEGKESNNGAWKHCHLCWNVQHNLCGEHEVISC